MTVTIAWDGDPEVRRWVVNKRSGRGLFGAIVDEQATASTQDEAIAAARRLAAPGERIVLHPKTGGRRIIREGA